MDILGYIFVLWGLIYVGYMFSWIFSLVLIPFVWLFDNSRKILNHNQSGWSL